MKELEAIKAKLDAAHPYEYSAALGEILAEALEAVESLHVREVLAVHEGYGVEAWCPPCREHWPCPTVVAITEALA